MERRVILAIVLMLIVAVLPSILFPPKKPAGRTVGRSDSTATPELSPARAAPPVSPTVRPSDAPAETVWVTSPLYRLGFSTRGGALVHAEVLGYRSFAPADSRRPVQLVREGEPLLAHRSISGPGTDTTAWTDWNLTPSATRVQVGPEGRETTLTFTGEHGSTRIALEYRFLPGDYRLTVQGRAEVGSTLLVGLGDGLRSVEADSMDDFRHYAVVTKAAKTQSTAFQSFKPDERKILDGPFEWVGVKSKYFFLAALAVEENQPRLGAAVVQGGARTVTASSLLGRSTVATRAAVAAPRRGSWGPEMRSDIGGWRSSVTISTMRIRTAASCVPSSSRCQCWW